MITTERERMRIFILFVLVYMVLPFTLWAQDETAQEEDATAYDEEEPYQSGDEKIRNYIGFNIQISTDGFVLGGYFDKKIAPYTHLGLSLDMFIVKGRNEIVDWTGRTLNSENIMILPLTLNVKRRLFPEGITNSFRPFVAAGAGGIYGYYFSGDVRKAPDHKRSQYTPTAFVGLGADFGKPGSASTYGMDIRYQIIRFSHSLGERSRFDNFQVGFHMGFSK